ncbi:(Fe-S)-binding protein [Natronospira sp.]|uniref:(Fe-S)-binding protein n=1 Tax=Natronospira TaxID=2024969 RepID=UPI0038736F02
MFPKNSGHRNKPADERADFPLADADRCVKCALCLPHCPTYRLTRNENESPRGRIALMQGLAQEALPLDERAASHLEQCLGCRNCEPVCPAEVPYGRLIDAGRRMVRAAGHRSRRERWATAVMTRPWATRLTGGLLRLYQWSGMQWLARHSLLRLSPGLARLDGLLPDRIGRHRRRAAVRGEGKAVQLFLGCLAEEIDPGVSDAAIRLLERSGHQVVIPPNQACCSAPAQHGGDDQTARRLSDRNVAAFDGDTPVLATASGCTASLMEYDEIVSEASHRRFAGQVVDICDWLQRLDWGSAQLSLNPIEERALLHLPCSQRNVVGATGSIADLLARIPGLELLTLDSRGQCCGAAGTYLLGQAAFSEQLGQALADKVVAERPRYLLTSNIGCKLQLRRQLRRRLPECEVLHPIELLARQLQ